MKYIKNEKGVLKITRLDQYVVSYENGQYAGTMDIECLEKCRVADTIEELCDCFIKIKRKNGCKPFILKHDFRDLPTLIEQKIKYPNSDVYGAIHIENKGLIYVAKMNSEGILCLL